MVLFTPLKKRRLRQSFIAPVVTGSRDTFRYYKNGHSTTVYGELMSMRSDVNMLIYRRYPLKWNDTGEVLTSEDSAMAFRTVGDYLDKNNIRWKFG